MQSLKRTSKIPVTGLLLVYISLLTKYILFRRPAGYIVSCFRNLRHADLHTGLSRANFIPFKTILYYLSGLERTVVASENLLGNFIGFMPLGLLVPLVFEKERTAKNMLAASFLTSFLYEFIQLVTGLGIFDVDDLLLNSAGGLAGYFVFTYFNRQIAPLNSH